ncbi:MAG: AmmeMemoRadiSam system radical SAM enzyme [Firmicutes bacterium]|nr:AmmeMemoRadiSam system radical SAM enzyme [Bacillota bacterium]
MKEALFYEKLDNNKVKCKLCPHNCIIKEGNLGICRVRENNDGTLYTINYNKLTSYNIDPIEKKPLYHYYPGSNIFSIGSFGCNLKCSFCQNHSIAHEKPRSRDVTSEELVNLVSLKNETIGLCYTYNEPSIWYEYVLDCAKRGKKMGLKNVLVTNGYIKEKPLEMLLDYIDALNIDLKSFSENYYNDICSGDLESVLNTINLANKKAIVEISTLLIEDLNTSKEEIKRLAEWIASIDEDIPLHLNRYYPAYKMKLPPTSIEKINEARDLAKKYLNYVYIGNVMGVDNDTYCPNCNTKIVSRDSSFKVINIKDNKCENCGKEINIKY